MNKKGQIIPMLSGIAISALVITIVLIVGFLIMKESKDIIIDDFISANTTTETVAWTNNTYVTLTYSTSSIELSCTEVRNGTDTAILIGVGNYTCDTQGFKLVQFTGPVFNTTVNLTYNWKAADAAWNATSITQDAVAGIPGWLPIIIITMIGAGLISLVAIFRRQ